MNRNLLDSARPLARYAALDVVPRLAVMRSLALCLVLLVTAGAAKALPVNETTRAADERVLSDAVFVRPLYGAYRHCGGACLKSGTLTWFCFARQSCYLSCATAPPLMKCAAP